MIIRLLGKLRLLFLGLPLIYILVLGSFAFARSQARHSVVSGAVFQEGQGDIDALANESSNSNVHLQQFERVEFRAGVPVWSVKATEAHYFPSDAVTIVNQPNLKVYRGKDDDVLMNGDVARLNVVGTALLEARMDGNVGGDLGSGIKFATTQGNYLVKDRVFRTREPMSIHGTGFEVTGVGFIFHMDTGVMDFEKQVSSVFRSGAVPPKQLPTFGADKRKPGNGK